MKAGERVFLMYHELELPGRPLCQSEPGYVRYIISAQDFRSQIDSLRMQGCIGLSVSQAFSEAKATAVVLTFDDGCETDLLAAAPILGEAKFNATFFVTVGFLDKPGYLSRGQLRELAGRGFDIGCHSMTHPYLSDLDEKGLHWEIADAKDQLEQIVGHKIENFSCPGGRWDLRVAQVARNVGYKTVCTSHVSANSNLSDPFRLGRVAVMRGTTLEIFQRLCCGNGLGRMRLKEAGRVAARQFLGNAIYDRLRTRLLRSDT